MRSMTLVLLLLLLLLLLAACAGPGPATGRGPLARTRTDPFVVETPMLALYACTGSTCSRKERWFQPAGEPARCSCARGNVGDPCPCEHELVGLYQIAVTTALDPPPDESGDDRYTAHASVAAFAVNAAGERLVPVALDSVFVVQQRIAGAPPPADGALASRGDVLLDRDGQHLRMRAEPVSGSRSQAWALHVDLRGCYRWTVETTIAGSGVPVTVAIDRAVR